jgi:hypothetical protein
LSFDDIVEAKNINFGACVVGIAKNRSGKFSIGHFQPGEIITELKALADQNEYYKVCVYQSDIVGKIGELYVKGHKINKKKINSLFYDRDIRYF